MKRTYTKEITPNIWDRMRLLMASKGIWLDWSVLAAGVDSIKVQFDVTTDEKRFVELYIGAFA